ncbi:hypothetical protein JQK15_20225 [Sphingobium sp. BHU LFT2]|uniref:hypothetical protein n=1 Tax=Sphingobium sp. BHU LFT2 TaxID=2807634 RepID=UPI001BEC8974|nr:hypothetical protein [Sphingobium sp. BHU LFT2]MBT2245843.1 hypothetical protein [Sphingobium sp. BHU LFT2]
MDDRMKEALAQIVEAQLQILAVIEEDRPPSPDLRARLETLHETLTRRSAIDLLPGFKGR